MTLETILIIVVAAGFCCYLVYRWQEAAVDMAVPPYQEPVKTDMVDEWKQIGTARQTVKCNQDCNQGRDCDCFQRSCDLTVEEFDTQLNPKATWPFPVSTKP
jgi:hypothetical protein